MTQPDTAAQAAKRTTADCQPGGMACQDCITVAITETVEAAVEAERQRGEKLVAAATKLVEALRDELPDIEETVCPRTTAALAEWEARQ